MEVKEKVRNFFGLNTVDVEEYDDYEDIEEEEEYEAPVRGGNTPVTPINQSNNNNNGKVLNIHSAADAKVIITRPTKYDDSVDICTALRNRNIVIINTSALETKVARRLLDFVSGAAYALDGNLEDIETRVYVVSPSNVHVSNELKTELSSKGIFNWK
ncbi:cell division protein SepF [uncultured Clostridium sp.]|uniref:cell division protein SepF n=1 Tax=uncultured Clostridium sp. TaxID=59620 RepID=UPI00262DDCA5|nr:cell division protein SepF [uncultured Clostridium sp.]